MNAWYDAVPLTPELAQLAQSYDGQMTFRFLVAYCGGFNEVFDALLDDTLPPSWREEANCLVNRQELIARAQVRFSQTIKKLCP